MPDDVYVRPPNPGRFVVQSVLAVRAALLKLVETITPPELTIFEHAFAVVRTQMVHVAAKLKIADHLEADGALTAAELAERTSANADALDRMLRALSSFGVFQRDRQGRYTNTRISRTLRTGALGGPAFAHYFGSSYNVHAWAELEYTVMTGKSAFEKVHGVSYWDYFAKHPDQGKVFAEAMANATELEAPGVAAVYPFKDAQRVCDVAGGSGTLLGEILAQHPHLEGVLFDGELALTEAKTRLRRRKVEERCQFTSGNFFQSVPRGADTYLLKDVLHDWDDGRAATILANCRRAMDPGHRLLVIEMLLVDEPRYPLVNLSDMHMMTVCSEGRQRTAAEFGLLLERAGFRVNKVHPLPGFASIVEALAS